jgi:two-component system, OmpR family, response regulator VanR
MWLNSLKVLFVEPNDEIRDTMKELLSYEVEEIETVKDPIEALNLYKTNKPHIIITNIDLPHLDGIEFIRKIRKNDNSVKIIVLTTNSDQQTLLDASELKLTKYLLIPTSGDAIYDALKKVIEELKSFSVIEHTVLELQENYRWDFKEQKLQKDLKEIHLTPKERKILHYLFSNPNLTVSYDMLFYEVWDDSETYSINTIKTMIKNIRKKLPPNTIKNIYATGFKFEH